MQPTEHSNGWPIRQVFILHKDSRGNITQRAEFILVGHWRGLTGHERSREEHRPAAAVGRLGPWGGMTSPPSRASWPRGSAIVTTWVSPATVA